MNGIDICFGGNREDLKVIEIKIGTKGICTLEKLVVSMITKNNGSREFVLEIDTMKPSNEDHLIETIKGVIMTGCIKTESAMEMHVIDKMILIKFIDMYLTKCEPTTLPKKDVPHDQLQPICLGGMERLVNYLNELVFELGHNDDLINMIIDMKYVHMDSFDQVQVRMCYNQLLCETGLDALYEFAVGHTCTKDTKFGSINMGDHQLKSVYKGNGMKPNKKTKVSVSYICGPDCQADSHVMTFHKMLSNMAKKMGLKRMGSLDPNKYPEVYHYMEQADITCTTFYGEQIGGRQN